MSNLNMITPLTVQGIINKFCYTIGMLPTSYKESLTYEEQLIAIGHYLENTVFPAINNNAQALAELQELFAALHNYVANYFDNLDVQTEVNNKIDEMAESGQLQEIISLYLNSIAIFSYDTVNDMKNATNLISGSVAKTLGYYNLNDNGGALYYIRNITNADVIDEMFIIALNDEQNQLVAQLIPEQYTISLKQLGLIGDGTTDETTKLQKAFLSPYNILINNGTYVTNDELQISTKKEVKGFENSLLIAKKDMPINKAIIKITSDNVCIDGLSISGNIAQNPIGDMYNSEQGIALIDIIESSNIIIKNCNLIDNAYGGCRVRGISVNNNMNHITFRNNKCLNIDCGIITMSSATNLTNLKDLIIVNNTFDGHTRSEPISIFHYGTTSDVIITNNIVNNKSLASGIYIGNSTTKCVNISNNVLTDVSTGVNLNYVQNGIVANNVITSNLTNIHQGMIIKNCSNIKINNNNIDGILNYGLQIENSIYLYINDNFIKNLNATNHTDSYKEGLRIKDCTYIYATNNMATNNTYTVLYNLMGACTNLYINELSNNSNTTFGFQAFSLTADLTNSVIKTNLSIRSNFTHLSSNTTLIEQIDGPLSTGHTATSLQLYASYRFVRNLEVTSNVNGAFSVFEIYNIKDYSIYTITIIPTSSATISLTNDTVNNFGITWKTERNITTPTQVKLMYYNNKFYEV